MRERILTRGPGGRVLTNCNVWCPDSRWIVYDTRPDPAGGVFEGPRIEMVHADTGVVRVLYEAKHGAKCGVATWHPKKHRVAFILGPERPTTDYRYGPARRQGVVVDADRPGVAEPLDARDLTRPGTPGALRGGSHVHVWHPDGDWLSFTYDDQLAASAPRTVAVAVPGAVSVPTGHPRNHGGTHTSFLAVRPTPGGVLRACEEAWIGRSRSLAFQGTLAHPAGGTFAEVFVADLPTKPPPPSPGPPDELPPAVAGATLRRLTFTADRKHPGLSGPRHWLRSAPDGSAVGFLMADAAGVSQFWTVPPGGGPARQVMSEPWPVASAFTWHPGGGYVVFVRAGAVHAVEVATGKWRALTPPAGARPEACVASPDGKRVAFVREVGGANQIGWAEW